MSTKTTFKRIALVAVAALGFGVLTSVAPASAAASNSATAVTVNAIAPARATVQTAVSLSITGDYTASGSETQKLGARIISGPASTTSAIAFEAAPSTGPSSYASRYNLGTRTSTTASTTDTGTAIATMTVGVSATTIRANLLFTPGVAGTYQILVWANADAYAAGLPSAVINVTTAGAPASSVLTGYGTTFAKSAAATTGEGALLKVELKDAAGLATVPNAYESIDLSQAGAASAATVGIGGTAQAAGSKKSYTSTDFKYGVLYTNIDNTAAETITISVAGSGTLSSSGLTGSIALVSKTVNSGEITDASDITVNSAVTTANTSGYTALSGTVSTNLTSQSMEAAFSAALVAATTTVTASVLSIGYEVSDLSGVITGNIGSVHTRVATAAVEDESIVFSIAASLGTLTTTTYSVDMLDGTANADSDAIIFTGGLAAAYGTSNGTPSVALSAIGGTNTIKARVTNQFGGGVANHAVTASIAGRNALTTIAGALVTDASGYVTFTYTDAGTAATVLTQDVITFTSTASNDATGTATVNFGSVTVGTVTVTGAASADVAPAVTYTNISTAAAGPHGSAVAITATVKDANGNVLAGVPVTFTLSGNAGSAIQKTAATDFTTVYTGTAGTAITNVIGWTNGATTVTATAGGKSGTGMINFLSGTTAANATANARVLSGTVAGDLLSYKVVDRFGNPVPGVSISLSRTGSGLFGGGTSTQTLTTDDNGTADAVFNGEGSVKAKLATTYYQAYDVAGEVDATAVTAPTAGTTIGTGSTFAPAGVNTVTLAVAAGSSATTVAAQAAADAAAEATDAANAATDAANAAAEAADAATAAAQDAADAVAALSTQVTELVSALRKQITSLTNLVIKIQKKVRA